MQSSLRIIVTGLITQHPLLAGMTWHHLQYVVGLKRLGHDVYYFEDSGKFPYNIDGGSSGTDWIARDCSYNVSSLAAAMARFGLQDRWAYHFALNSEWFGLSDGQRRAVIESADILVNVSGSLEHPISYRRIPHLLYLDTDPVVTQIKLATGNTEIVERVEAHDSHFSFGESLSDSAPRTGQWWRPTRQPIVLSEWRPSAERRESFTTVMNWTSYEPLVYSGQTYGQKDIEFRRFIELPARAAPTAMEVALSRTQYLKWCSGDGNPHREAGSSAEAQWTPFRLLTDAGWRVVDSIEMCGDLESYRQYIESSKAEWSVAKNAYVRGRPGWFSERSACYLAAGRPVVVQDTGFAGVLPVGEGILTFETLPEAVAAIQEVETNYRQHAEAARAVAETYFDSDKVLSQLIERALTETDRALEAPPRQSNLELTSAPAIRPASAASQQPPRRHEPLEILRDHLREHPAVTAWAAFRPGRVEPDRIEVLKRRQKGAVYRLIGIGRDGSAVIAKRCRHERAVTERTVYEEVLPCLPLATLHYYGCVEEDDGRFCWLFLEDAGPQRYSPLVAGHRSTAAMWLGAMHSAAQGLQAKVTLPDRGPAHYRSYLRSAQQAIPRVRALPSLKSTEQTTLLNILALCEFLEENWDHVEKLCDPLPRTFIHGDCLAKNVHVRTVQAGLTIAPFDWAGSGWGLPATDLGQLGLPYRDLPQTDPDCAAYLSSVRDKWPGLDLHTVQQLANLGQMFWSLKVISRGLPEFDLPGAHIETLIDKFSVYRSVLGNTIREADWKN